MSLQFIIDGYNIIHNPAFTAAHKKVNDCRRALLWLIKQKGLCGSPKNKISIVFDGYADASELRQDNAGIDIIFSGDRTADEKIKSMVETSLNPKNTVVVSNDNQVKFFVKSVGGNSMPVEKFINRKEKRRVKDSLKIELTFSQIDEINKELKALWLK